MTIPEISQCTGFPKSTVQSFLDSGILSGTDQDDVMAFLSYMEAGTIRHMNKTAKAAL